MSSSNQASGDPALPPAQGVSARQTGDRLLAVAASIQQELDALKTIGSDQDRRSTDLLAREGVLAARAAELAEQESRLAAAEEHGRQAQQLLDAAERELDAAAQRLASESRALEAREQARLEQESALKARDAELARRESELGSAGESARRGAEADQRKQAEIEDRDRTVRRLSEELEKTRSLSEQSRAARESLEQAHSAEIAKRDRALEAIHARLRATEAGGESLQKELGGALEHARELERELTEARERAAGLPLLDVAQTPFNERRRDRLKRLKSLLEGRAQKVLRARQMLAQRVAECDQVLGERAAVSRERAALEQQALAVQARAARTGGAVIAMCVGVMGVAIMLGSWSLAGVIQQPTYLAQLRLGMEEAGREPTGEQVESWTSFHESLAADPQLLEQVAEKMRRRGFAELARPGDLRARLNKDLSVEPAGRGQLSISLRGEGKARTEKLLETFAGTLVQIANDSRERRLDRAATLVLAGAHAGDDPIEDPRVRVFGALAGGLSALALLVGAVGWRLMLARRSRREALRADEEVAEWTGAGR